MSRFINTELESDSETESKSDTELMVMLKSSSDSDSGWIILLPNPCVSVILSKSKHILVNKIFKFF